MRYRREHGHVQVSLECFLLSVYSLLIAVRCNSGCTCDQVSCCNIASFVQISADYRLVCALQSVDFTALPK